MHMNTKLLHGQEPRFSVRKVASSMLCCQIGDNLKSNCYHNENIVIFNLKFLRFRKVMFNFLKNSCCNLNFKKSPIWQHWFYVPCCWSPFLFNIGDFKIKSTIRSNSDIIIFIFIFFLLIYLFIYFYFIFAIKGKTSKFIHLHMPVISNVNTGYYRTSIYWIFLKIILSDIDFIVKVWKRY